MCIGTIRRTEGGLEVCVLGVAHSVSKNLVADANHAALCLGAVDRELVENAFANLVTGMHPEDVELRVTRNDPDSPSRQWILATMEHGCHAWYGTRCTGYRAAATDMHQNAAVIMNWGSRPQIANSLLKILSEERPINEILCTHLRRNILLVPARSAITVCRERTTIINFASNEATLCEQLLASNSVIAVPEAIKRAWLLVSNAYRLLFHEPGNVATKEGLALFERARELDPKEIQAFLWPIIAYAALNNHAAVRSLLNKLLGMLCPEPKTARRRAETLLDLIDTESVGLGVPTHALSQMIRAELCQ